MVRWIAVLAVLLLAGCASTRPHYYDDGYYAGGRYVDDGYYDDARYGGYYDDGYYGGSRYYRGDAGYGDYYYADAGYRYPSYFESPYYYSLFWPINRWSYDPYWYPNYYYGVTWFPRNYFSVGLSFGSRWSYGGFAYSPYRYGWADSFYDWSPWYHRYGYGRHYDRPRFGNAANEAERLARLSGRGVARDGFASRDARSSAWRGDRDPATRGMIRGTAGVRGGAMPQRGRAAAPFPRRQATDALPRSERGVPMRRGSSERPLRRTDAALRTDSAPAARARAEALRANRPQARDGYAREGYAVPRAPGRSAQRAYVAPRGAVAPYDGDARRGYAPRVQEVPRGYGRSAEPRPLGAPAPERVYRGAPAGAAVYTPAPVASPRTAPEPRSYDGASESYAPPARASRGDAPRAPRRGRRDDP